MEREKDSLRKSLENAGFYRASLVYESYCEDRTEIICNVIKEEEIETLEDFEGAFLKKFLPNGQPRPSFMKEHDWHDNLDQIFWDCYSDVKIDSSIFHTNDRIKKMDLINSFFNEEEVFDALWDGAEQFIIDKYDFEYLSQYDNE